MRWMIILLRISPTKNRFVWAHSWRDPTEDIGISHEQLLPPTTYSLASMEVNSRNMLRSQNGIVVLKEAIGSITEIQTQKDEYIEKKTLFNAESTWGIVLVLYINPFGRDPNGYDVGSE